MHKDTHLTYQAVLLLAERAREEAGATTTMTKFSGAGSSCCSTGQANMANYDMAGSRSRQDSGNSPCDPLGEQANVATEQETATEGARSSVSGSSHPVRFCSGAAAIEPLRSQRNNDDASESGASVDLNNDQAKEGAW